MKQTLEELIVQRDQLDQVDFSAKADLDELKQIREEIRLLNE